MTSSIRRIDLKEALQSYHQTTDSPTLLSGWDETIADDDDFSPSDADAEEALHQRSHIRGTSITPHAMAHKSWVFGITEKDEDGSDEDNRRYYTNYHDNNNKKPTQDWKIRWKTSLAPHRINQVASNPSGTVIAATTDNGAVSIIRGSDGRVLATRRVVVKEQQDSAALEMAPEASFITTHQRCSSNSQNSTIVGDALLVQTPDQPTLLVSNIQGDRLNDNNDSVVTRATKSMNLQMVKIPSIQSFDIQCLRGYFYYSKKKPPFLNDDDDEDINYDTKIRLTLIHNDLTGEARLALAEYDLGSQSCQLIQKNISLGSSWEIDTITGLRLISFADRFVLALAAHSIGQSRHQQQFNSKIIWIDPDHDLDTHKVLSDTGVVMVKGEYPLVSVLQENGIIQEHTNKYQRCRIQALEFTHACNSQEAIAMVVAIEGEKKSSNVQILQTQVILEDESQDETCSTLQLGRAHLVYRLLIPSTVGTVQSICLCPLDKEIYGPYSFRSMTSLGWNRHEEIHAFQTRKRSGDNLDIVDRHDGSAIGAIRLLITKQEFNKARALVHDVGMEILLQDEYAQFHPAEIVLEKLRQSLVSSSSSSSSSSPLDRSIPNENWYESLTGLKRGTGNEKGQRVVLEAADYLLNWHPNTEIKDASSLDFQISLKQLASYLSSFVETMKNVSNDFLDQDVPSWISVPYQNRVHALEERMIAIQYLNDLLNNINSDDDAVVCLESEVSTNSMLSPQYSSIGSIDDLFSCFVQNGNFVAAEEMWGSTMRSKLTVETMVSSILRIPSTIAPRKYATLLDEIVLPSLSINHELVPSILSWSCQMADEFDDVHEDGLDRSIYLLETIERATKILRLNVHSSFAYYSPFVDQANSGNSKGRLFSFKDRTTNVSKSGILSLDSSFGSEGRSLVSHHSDDSISFDKRVKNDSSTKNNNQRPNPTILELGRMKRGAARLGQIPSLGVEAIDENEGNVGLKLETARWLKLARSLGLGRRLVSLCNFVDQGGAEFVSKELIRYFSSSAISHEERYDGLTIDVKKFCNESRAGYDKALMAYTKELCGGKNTSPQAIEEVASIARCCLSPTSKCQVTKIALQAALFCRFSASWLGLLSKDAIEWSSGDSSLRSELEEASRLLLIDCIVGRYCGNGAKELFHVDNPLHAANLLNFVSKHLDHDSVLSDILDLCEAFHHLSVEDGCGRLIQNTVLKGNQIKAKGFLLDLYDRNIASAHNIFSRVISFCIDLIEDNTSCIRNFSDVKSDFQSSMREEESKIVTLCAYDLTKIALVHSGMIVPGRIGSGFSTSHYNELKLQSLLHDLEQLKILQQDHNIFVSLADLNNPKVLVEISSKLLNGLADLYIKGEFNAASSIATQTRRACSLLSRPPMLTESDLLFTSATPVACQLALKTNGLEALDFLSDLRILEASQSNFASRCCLAVALSYCMKLSKKSEPCLLDKMKGLVMASSLLEDYILSHCPPQILGISVDLSQLCGIVSQVLARADEGVGEKLDVFRKVLLERAAEKRWSFALHKNDIGESLRISQPTLHPSWYVGDGLLLPPEEALRKGIDYCKQSMGLQLMDDPSMGIHAFVASRGAHALALRILSHSTMVQICLPQSDCSLEELVDFNQQIGIELVERYLGGVGNGITSGVVDSQLAAAFLLSLPLKLAFKIYRSSLPTAISTRDFSRVVTLATVGKVCSSKDSIMSPTGARVGNWTSQNKFVSQCDSIATEATWWCVLEENDVNFNPHSFDYKEKNNLEDSYTASMIPALIFNMMSGKDGEIDSTLELVVKFANAFSLPNDIPACRFIQYLLSPIESDHDQYARQKISCLDDTVRKLLRLLDCSSKRINILRKCLIQFEGQDNCVDYERLCVLYATYQTEINIVLTKNSTDKNEPCMEKFYVEMEVIDRRRDALAILSSYFQGDKTNERPSFSQFFAPLNESIDDNTNMEISSKLPSSRILGWEMTPKVDTFDPLNGLEKILRASCSSAVTSALSPICLPLGVPRGYIRVRSLITRFQKSNAEGASLPAFEDDVLPTLSQLRAPSDVAEVAEWCSKQYGLDTSENKLKCLDYALNYAIKASMEFERSVGEGKEDQNKGKNDDDELLALTLTRVKRITSARDLLADRLEITKILTLETKIRGLSKVLKRLNNKLEREVWSKSESFVPERFVDTLFTEASLLVAEATLCENESLSVGQFRQLSHLIHRVCNLISGKYSHVQTGYLARRLTRRWLFHGDMQASETDKEKNDNMIPVISQHNNLIPDIQEEEDTEEDTVNFQMDLSILKGDKGWATDFSTGAINSTKEKKKLTSEEEPTSLQATSEREISELASHRSSLRIAFVIAFADGYHRSLYNDSNDGNNEENNENSETVLNLKTNMSKMPREGLLSKMKKTRMNEHSDQHTSVLEHARELVRIVFAKSTSTDLVMKGLNESFNSISVSGSNRSNPATLTFAMRHRCLRVASILVPQEALEEVLNEDNFASNSSLKACSFGSFCAKELEETGLPIPHSDLLQLSQMHFPSYARALWRHHRDIKGAKGRLLLLILELYLKESISDNTFFLSIIEEIETLNLPRTLLNAFECIVRYMDKIGPTAAPSFLGTNIELHRITKKLLQHVYADLKRNIDTSDSDMDGDIVNEDRNGMMSTITRLGRIIAAFSNTSGGQRVLVGFSQELINIFPVLVSMPDECQGLRVILEHTICRVADSGSRLDLFGRLSELIDS
mmetsp:Transcript_64447/g.74194  ORF Transcript_64447/g.74194 Transcript_64447/m.74194 type:complete len:2711 (+) Transcript_64447:55-8187(+)